MKTSRVVTARIIVINEIFNMRESICGFILGGLVVLTFHVRELLYKMSGISERSFRIYQVFMKKLQIKLTCSRTTC